MPESEQSTSQIDQSNSAEVQHVQASALESVAGIVSILKEISPQPKIKHARRRKRKAQSATHLTGTPNKEALEAKTDACSGLKNIAVKRSIAFKRGMENQSKEETLKKKRRPT